MPNEFSYVDQLWGEPIPDEVLSVNACCCGEHLGSVMQDAEAVEEDANSPHYNERAATVHLGTVMQDAIEGSTPELEQ